MQRPTVKEIVGVWLLANGYDGLWDGFDCGCAVEDNCFMDGDCSGSCTPAHKVRCGDDCVVGNCDGGCDWHMVAEKPADSGTECCASCGHLQSVHAVKGLCTVEGCMCFYGNTGAEKPNDK